MALTVTLVYCPMPRKIHEVALSLPDGATVQMALHASGIGDLFPELNLLTCTVGIWGRKCDHTQVLRHLDRVEIYRKLLVDPKIARRERFSKQGVKRAGLFANKRSGAKAGY
jgi:putative ubiquitin-RnfH superfamily antitoxin RatB of RatAB toxin-antitoxin module